jgi:hypothetical protein
MFQVSHITYSVTVKLDTSSNVPVLIREVTGSNLVRDADYLTYVFCGSSEFLQVNAGILP